MSKRDKRLLNIQKNMDQGKFEQAAAALRKLLSRDKNNIAANVLAGVVHRKTYQYEKAAVCFRRALTLRPGLPEAISGLANLYRMKGDIPQSNEIILDALKTNTPRPEHIRTLLLNGYDDLEFVTEMLDKIKDQDLNTVQRSLTHHAYFLLHSKNKNYSVAIQNLDMANELQQLAKPYNTAEIKNQFKGIVALKAVFEDAYDLHAIKSNLTPIFIVGMPRTGSTLISSIVSASPDVTDMGECNTLSKYVNSQTWVGLKTNKDVIKHVRENYLRDMQKFTSTKYFIDKMLFNFRWLPFIHVCFPEAKILITQRDRKAMAWSIYKTYFEDVGLGFSNSHANINDQYLTYKQFLSFSHNLKINTFTIDYTTLVTNPISAVSEIFSYLGLEFNVDYLSPQARAFSYIGTASSSQVREKITTNSDLQYREYREYLPKEYFS